MPKFKIKRRSMFKFYFTTLFLALNTAVPASAAVYSLLPFNYNYNAPIFGSAYLTTQEAGVFRDSEITAFLNRSSYNIGLYSVESTIAAMNQDSSEWELSCDGSCHGATLTVETGRMMLDFSTPSEYSGLQFIARGNVNGKTLYLGFAQYNNVSNYNFSVLHYDISRMGYFSAPYNYNFEFPAAVPEPSTLLISFAGLIAMLSLLGLPSSTVERVSY